VGISVPWFDRANSSLQQQQQQGRGGSNGRGYNSYYEPPALIKLHNEMVSFVKLMEPTKEELKVRDMLVNRITDLAVRTFGKKVSLD
jgi:DNA polymerase sigma